MTNEEAIKNLRELLDREFSIEYAQALVLSIAELERDRWISVEERLPEENGYYLVKVCSPHIPVRAYEYKPDREWDDNDKLWKGYDGSYVFDHFVTHWRPLPEPPKEET